MARVMVVDDMPVIRDIFCKILRREGYDTCCAASAKEALDTMSENNPDLVLMDFTMPEMDGLTCLEILRGQPRWETLPVIMLTAIADSAVVNSAYRLGAADFLVKTQLSIPQVLDRVKKVFERGKPAATDRPAN